MPSFGEELQRERELREISLREIAEATKVNIRYLEAIERNDFEHLPGGVFNRGFVRAYAQYIGIDPEGMVNAYLLEEQAQTERRAVPDQRVMRGEGRAKDTLGVTDHAAPRQGRAIRWGLILLLLAILIAAGVLIVDVVYGGAAAAAPSGRPSAVERNLE